MDFRQLESFISASNHKSFTAAADELFLSQPTISAHIRTLENELRTQLIRRTTKNFELTADGERLYDYATSLLHLKNKVLTEFTDLHKKTLYIGASSIPGKYVLPQFLPGFHQEFPDIQFEIFHDDSVDVISKVIDSSYDLGFVGTKGDSECSYLPIARDELIFATPNTPYYRNLIENNVSLEKLIQEPIVLRAGESGTKREAERWLSELGFSLTDLNVVASISDAEMLCNAIAKGLGISIISKRMAEYPNFNKELLLYTPDGMRVTRNLYMVYVENRWLPDAVRDFIAYVRKEAENSRF